MTVVVIASSDFRLRSSLGTLLRANDFVVVEASDGLQAFRAVFMSQPDAAIIDLSIQKVDGVELVRILRAASDLAIVALLNGGDQSRGVQALEDGADDVVRHHTSATELIARLNASLRRSRREPRAETEDIPLVATGDLVIDRTSQRVTRAGKLVPLTRTEYRLIDALASRVGQVAPHRFLLSTVWGDEYVDDTHYLRVYVGYLRAKLEDTPGDPRYILSEWGVGYRLAALPVEVRREDAGDLRRVRTPGPDSEPV